MITRLITVMVKMLLWGRYRVRVHGLDEIRSAGARGILFLPNHPAMIDPIILMSQLQWGFKARVLADRDQIDRFVIRRLAARVNVPAIPDMAKFGASAGDEVRRGISQCIAALRGGDNLVLYPAGRTYRQRLEDLAGSSAVHSILRELPDVRIVLVRTRGLWGSMFSRASGAQPSIAAVLRRGVRSLLSSGLFFAPRRKVSIEFTQPADIPRQADRLTINRYLERFYNEDAPANTYVPYTIWERGGVRELPEPQVGHLPGDLAAVPPATRQIVREFLAELAGCRDFDDDSRLAHDLGMDSLAGAELMTFLQSEFGFAPSTVDSLRTVGDVMLAGAGQSASSAPPALKKISRKWFRCRPDPHWLAKLPQMSIGQAFLAQARRWPDKSVIADQTSGVKTYRDIVLAIMLLKDEIRKLPGDRVGIMMPASVGASVLYLATLFAGKTPAMINWTLGRRNLLHCLAAAGVERIITADAVVSRIRWGGIDLDYLDQRLVNVEDIARAPGLWAKLKAFVASRCCWSPLRAAERHMPPVAAILFTSGSESDPKAVPLTHRNMLTNVHDARECFTLSRQDSFLGILPPFHSFGLTTSVLMPLCLGLRAVYWPNPTDGAGVAAIIDAYKVTIPIATPTFLTGVMRWARREQLDSVRLIVTGAEKCSARVYQTLAKRCPGAIVLEGYGVTECSPIVTVNHQDDPRPGTIGRVMGSLEYVIVDPETNQPVPADVQGMLLVRGSSVFAGYLDAPGGSVASPFVQFAGLEWYRTGDLVVEDADGVLTFAGRLKRFIKLGGEMVSLPAIESVLEAQYGGEDGPELAVIASGDDNRAEIIMFTTRPIDRESANRTIRRGGLSGLHNIRKVVRLEVLPLLGTGKVDYRALEAQLTPAAGEENH